MSQSTTPIRIPIHLQQQVMGCLRESLELASQKLGKSFPLPKIAYRKKGSVAGTAHLIDWTIKLNSQLLIEHQKPFIDEVIPHELAHLLVFSVYGRVKPHGKEWQWMMNDVLECSPKRTHQFTNSQIIDNQFLYQCQCKNHYLSTIRHKKVQKNQIEYICTRCKQKLHFKK